MNLVKNRPQLPNLREEEVTLVENAVRLAIDSIVNVLCGVNNARSREHQQKVADRDKEIQRLESRLREIERELRVLRQQGCTCSLFAAGACAGTGLMSGSQAVPGARLQGEQQGGFEGSCMEDEMTAAQQECEMSISLGLFARPPSHVSSQSHESAPPPSSPSSKICLEQVLTPHSSEASGVSEAARLLPTSPCSLVVKEEPCDVDTVLIKWEMSEDRFGGNQESRSSSCLDGENLPMTRNHEATNIMEKPQTSTDGSQNIEAENPRNKKRSVPMSELPEEAQRQKRAAWRAASRRYYARKVARQQANPSHCQPFPHVSSMQYSQPLSLAERRRRATLISHLPEESQLLQREAWRAASRRYYARKTARHQMEHSQYGHLLQSLEPSGGAPPDADRVGSHTNSDGILCGS